VTVSWESIPPGRSRSIRVVVWVRPKATKLQLGRTTNDVRPLMDLIRDANLADGELLQLERIRPIAEKAAGGKVRDVDKARALYDYMVAHCRYDIDFHQDAASSVLEGQAASCSELAYTYVALCRSLGIPPVSSRLC